MKYKSPRLDQMSGQLVDKWAKTLLMKIHVITGWVIPDNSELLIILIDQFQKHLIEKYSELNVDEIEFAFRDTGTAIEDWGKQMNLNLIDKVLIPYVNKRFIISDIERRVKEQPPAQIIYTDEQLDNFTRRDIEIKYQQMRKGIVPYGMPDTFKAVLITDGLMKLDESLSNFFVQRLGNGFKNIYEAK